MDAQTDEKRTYVDILINRLRRQYVEQTPLPSNLPDEVLSFEMLQRLCLYVLNEGYGE